MSLVPDVAACVSKRSTIDSTRRRKREQSPVQRIRDFVEINGTPNANEFLPIFRRVFGDLPRLNATTVKLDGQPLITRQHIRVGPGRFKESPGQITIDR